MTGGRRRKNDLPRGFAAAGGVIGLWIASQHPAHAHATRCPKAATCLSHAVGAAVAPLAVGALVGAFIGLGLALVVLLLVRAVRLPKPRLAVAGPATSGSRRVRRASPTSAVSDPAQRVDVRAAAVAPELTKPGLRALRLKIRTSVLNAMRELGGGGERTAIFVRAVSIGGFTSRELEARPPSRLRHKYARQIDHDLPWALTTLKRDGLMTNPARGIWMLTDSAWPEQESTIAEAVTPERLAELRAMPYDEYLRTPEWRQTRAAALVRADHRCALDPNHTDLLEVHHRYYDRLGVELPSDLIVLCRACHRRHHL